MHPPVGHAVAPLQPLAVQIGVIGEPDAGPDVALDVLHPALHFSLRLRPVGLAQSRLEAHPLGEVRHPPVPHRPGLLVTAQGHHLGVVAEAPPRRPAQVLEGVHVTLDEGGGVRSPDQLHVAGPRPAQRHHEHPDAAALAIFAEAAQAAPVHLGLPAGSGLETHRGIRLPPSPARRHVGLQNGVAAVIASGPQLPVHHNAVLQSFRHPPAHVFRVGVKLGRPSWPRSGPHGLR